MTIGKISLGRALGLPLVALALAFTVTIGVAPKVGAVGSSPGLYTSVCCSNYITINGVWAGSQSLNKSYRPGQFTLWSSSREYKVVFQTDGNLVEYTNTGGVVWATNTHNRGATRLTFQTDGNVVIYANNTPLWATNRYGSSMFTNNPSGTLTFTLQNDSNLVLYKGTPFALLSAVWARTW